ncbi:MAG: outer membrane lipoprotein carrier protein LolA [Defluviimonas sp.]|uniref:LolA family protein n=1 Tax=Albidovulum sp. TaxID=1872424 RepID=UPI001E06622E|nr:outer membrane lipoprotein carrier protein LolA [Paracoccaceae bacterium]MCC0063068.1 outer membrane lipoprotein carrier protein LolA [Defluviimonas sp.]
MKPTRLLLASILMLACAGPALAAKLPLSAISDYFNAMTTAEADFQQINADGSTSSGHIYIRRPGRMRFEYAPPDRTLVLASGGQVAVFDGKSNQPPEQYPLKRTPLNLILADRVDLTRAKMVVGHDEEGDLTMVTAQDPEHPELGTIRLGFSAAPVTLRQWTVTDDAGGQTTVILGPLVVGQSYATSLFSIQDEIRSGQRPGK